MSHLDQVRAMERALRRAKLPIAYSGGFTPRPIMSYSFALPVGALSMAEYGDFEFTQELDPKEFLALYNQYLPQGFRILEAECLQEGTLPLMREVNTALWEIFLAGVSAEEITLRWHWIQGEESFVVERETKKGKNMVDIRPFLFGVSQISPSAEGVSFQCLCSLGNEANLRLGELGALLGFDYLEATITRIGQYIKDGDQYHPPLGKRG